MLDRARAPLGAPLRFALARLEALDRRRSLLPSVYTSAERARALSRLVLDGLARAADLAAILIAALVTVVEVAAGVVLAAACAALALGWALTSLH